MPRSSFSRPETTSVPEGDLLPNDVVWCRVYVGGGADVGQLPTLACFPVMIEMGGGWCLPCTSVFGSRDAKILGEIGLS